MASRYRIPRGVELYEHLLSVGVNPVLGICLRELYPAKPDVVTQLFSQTLVPCDPPDMITLTQQAVDIYIKIVSTYTSTLTPSSPTALFVQYMKQNHGSWMDSLYEDTIHDDLFSVDGAVIKEILDDAFTVGRSPQEEKIISTVAASMCVISPRNQSAVGKIIAGHPQLHTGKMLDATRLICRDNKSVDALFSLLLGQLNNFRVSTVFPPPIELLDEVCFEFLSDAWLTNQ